MNRKDITIILISALLVTSVFAWFFNDDELFNGDAENNNNNQNEAISVEVVQPVQQDIATTINYLGTVKGEKDGNLTFRIPGLLETIHVSEGQKVKKGQFLASLSAPELDAQLNRAQSELKKASSAQNFWLKEASTDSVLFEDGAIAETVLNKTNFNYEQALRSYQAAKAAVDEVQERLKLTNLRAPGNGRIGSILASEGSNIAPHQPVIYMHHGDPIIFADVLQQDIEKGITIGTSVTAKLSDEINVSGKVERIDFQARPPFRSVRTFISFQDERITSFPSGTGISLHFEINKQKDALLVPVSSVDLRDGSPRLFRVDDNMKAEAVDVELGVQIGENRQIIGPVSQSDRVISSGINNVESGDLVKVVREIMPNSNL